jgi:hypothetical protein
MNFKELKTILILCFMPFSAFANLPNSEDINEKMVSSSASYFCEGNRNFLHCIKPSIDPASQACRAYVEEQSKKCVAENLNLTSTSTKSEINEAGVKYTQCSMLAMLEAEKISYPEFEQCFQKNYTESKINEKLKK